MSGNKILFDTNVFIRFLNGDKNLIAIIDSADKYISFLTEIELYCKPGLTDIQKGVIAELIAACTVLNYTHEMKDSIIMLRTRHKMKMPDAFIGATAIYHKLPMYTFDAGFLQIDALNILLAHDQ